MENAATDDDTSVRDAGGEHGHGDCKGGRTAAQDSVHQSASAVTEVGSTSSGNAAAEAEETRRRPGGGDLDGWLTVLGRKAVDDYYDPVEAETVVDGGEEVPPSPVRLAASRFGCLLLGFLAGTAAAVLFLMRHDSPVTTCTVVPT